MTPGQQAVRAADRIVRASRDPLGANLYSGILHGSATSDDFRPGLSDLDLLLVVERELTAMESDSLVEVVRAADPGPAGGVDLLVVTRRTAEAPADHPSRELLVAGGPGDDLEIEGRADDVGDLWPELSMARQSGHSLLGPPVGEVIAEVPPELVRATNAGWLTTWLDRTDDAKNAVFMALTACRMWRFAVDGQHVSKTAAARWAHDREPSLSAVTVALAARTTGTVPTIEADDIERLLRRALLDADA